jgi:hypothetical protein
MEIEMRLKMVTTIIEAILREVSDDEHAVVNCIETRKTFKPI